MDKIDTRKLSTEIQQHNRDQAIHLHLEGMLRKDIIRIIGVHASILNCWIALYNKGGSEALTIGQRGLREGEVWALSEPQERKLKEVILGKFTD